MSDDERDICLNYTAFYCNILDEDSDPKYHSPEDTKLRHCREIKRLRFNITKEKHNQSLDDYNESLKEIWNTQKQLYEDCNEDDSFGSKSNLIKIKKNIEIIEEELISHGVDIEQLKDGRDDEELLKDGGDDEELLKDGGDDEELEVGEDNEDDDELLKELDSDNDEGNDMDVDENPDNSKEVDFSNRKSAAFSIHKMPTMEEKKETMARNSSRVINKFSSSDPEDVMEKRLRDCIDAIEYLKKNNLSKDQKTLLNILDRAEQIKKLQKRHNKDGDVELHEIPREIIPDDILGFTIKQRIDKFQNINKLISKSMNELKLIGGHNFKIFNEIKNKVAKENYERSIKLFKKQAALKK